MQALSYRRGRNFWVRNPRVEPWRNSGAAMSARSRTPERWRVRSVRPAREGPALRAAEDQIVARGEKHGVSGAPAWRQSEFRNAGSVRERRSAG